MKNNQNAPLSYKCHPGLPGSKGVIKFSDGTVEVIPPATEADKNRILARVEAIKKPPCPKCGELQKARMRKNGQIFHDCLECAARRMLRKDYELLSDDELEDRLEDIHKSHRRRVAVISQIALDRSRV